jgi:hypothetical protein
MVILDRPSTADYLRTLNSMNKEAELEARKRNMEKE